MLKPLSLAGAIALSAANPAGAEEGVFPILRLFGHPLKAGAYTSQIKGNPASRARMEMQKGKNEIVEMNLKGHDFQAASKYWEDIFIIHTASKTSDQAYQDSVFKVFVMKNDWGETHVGSSIQVALYWKDAGLEVASCDVDARIDAKTLNADLSGQAWRVKCLSRKDKTEEKTTHYFIEDLGFDFVTQIGNLNMELLSVEK